MGCAISKQIFKNNLKLREIYINDEYRNLFGDKLYEVYVMKTKKMV
jgi:hypothetical protein